MKRWMIFGGLTLLVAVFASLATMPSRFVLDQVRARDAAITYLNASGTVWNGSASRMYYGIQPIGTLTFKTHWASLFAGRLANELQLTGSGLSGQASASFGLGGTMRFSNVRIEGTTQDLANLQDEIRELNGRFTLVLNSMEIRNGECLSAEGTVWTDLLSRLQTTYRWTGPEVTGPVRCENGQIVLELNGQNAVGEQVAMRLDIGLDATGVFTADVETLQRETGDALTVLGFVSDGANGFTYRYEIS
tara:strand:+ start:103230 stop:103973 length:744 start_codon:yes stop_codon:yes gene_type:complete